MITFDEYQEHFQKSNGPIATMFQKEFQVSAEAFSKLNYLNNKYLIMRGPVGLGNNEHLDIILSTVHKGLTNLYTIIDLTIHGNIGASRILMRNTFEFLVFGKYILICNDPLVRKKWDDMETINLDKRIFNNMIYPDPSKREAFLLWWQHLNQFTHATRASGQVEFEAEHLKSDIDVNFSFIYMFLYMIYSYMNRYLATQYIKNYIAWLSQASQKSNEPDKTIEYDAELKLLIKQTIFPSFTTSCKKIVRFYTAAWRFDTLKLTRQMTGSVSSPRQTIEQITSALQKVRKDHLPKTKEDLEEYLDDFIALYQSTHIAGMSDAHKNACLKYLKRLQKSLSQHRLPQVDDPFLRFEISISCTSIELSLDRISFWDRNDEYPRSSREFTLLEIKSEYIGIEQFANMYQVSIQTVQKWINHARIRQAKEIGGQWFIPELCDRPRGFMPVDYSWTSLPKHFIEDFPYLLGYKELSIHSSEDNKGMYDCFLRSRKRKKPSRVLLNEKERAELEHKLLRLDISFDEPMIYCVPG